MDRKECANGLQLIKIASLKLRGHFSELFIGCFAMVTPLILMLIIPIMLGLLFGKLWIFTIGLGLFMIFLGPLQMGYITYFNAVMEGKQPRLRSVYSYVNLSFFSLRSMYITSLLILMYLVGGVLYIIPAGFAISFFSMIPFFMERFRYERLSTAMKDTASKMIGNRLAMFSYKLIFYLVYFMLFIVCFLLMLLIDNLAVDSLIVAWLIAVCGIIVFVFLYAMVSVYYHSCNQIFFEDILTREEKRIESKKTMLVVKQELHNPDTKEEKEQKLKDESNLQTQQNDLNENALDKEPKEKVSEKKESKKTTKQVNSTKSKTNSASKKSSATKKTNSTKETVAK